MPIWSDGTIKLILKHHCRPKWIGKTREADGENGRQVTTKSGRQAGRRRVRQADRQTDRSRKKKETEEMTNEVWMPRAIQTDKQVGR